MAVKTGRRIDRHVASTKIRYPRSETIFAQGDACGAVMYIEKGRVSLTTSSRGREAVVSVLEAGAFFGEGALAGQRRRRATATAMTATSIAVIRTSDMRRGLHEETALSDWFRRHMLATNTRIEEDLIIQLFNRFEKRLARTLLLLTRFDQHHLERSPLPKISRDVLADALGTTRSKVDVLMNRFRKLGFLERNRERDGGMQVHRSMLSVVLKE